MTEIQSEAGGKVIISDEIIATIASKAALEAEGVTGLGGFFASATTNKALRKYLARGVNVAVSDDKVKLALAISVKMGTKIHEVSKDVQERVKAAIETMTGLTVLEVNIRVGAVSAEKRRA